MANMGLISIGVFLIIMAISIVIYSTGIIIWEEILPLITGLYGCWMIVLAGVRRRNPSKYERGALSILAWGLLLAVAGFSSILNIEGFMDIPYVAAAVLLVIGILVIAIAIEKR